MRGSGNFRNPIPNFFRAEDIFEVPEPDQQSVGIPTVGMAKCQLGLIPTEQFGKSVGIPIVGITECQLGRISID
ncbi:unnamed protein product [Anisakis simplex]|uniref:Amidase domain-containing protein n=1 Tax=Anisakis simplex TaxID=6269 RepID=A0A0M3JUJ9_ANISI|nr:unnamed protein product [Anisakis simplex]